MIDLPVTLNYTPRSRVVSLIDKFSGVAFLCLFMEIIICEISSPRETPLDIIQTRTRRLSACILTVTYPHFAKSPSKISESVWDSLTFATELKFSYRSSTTVVYPCFFLSDTRLAFNRGRAPAECRFNVVARGSEGWDANISLWGRSLGGGVWIEGRKKMVINNTPATEIIESVHHHNESSFAFLPGGHHNSMWSLPSSRDQSLFRRLIINWNSFSSISSLAY